MAGQLARTLVAGLLESRPKEGGAGAGAISDNHGSGWLCRRIGDNHGSYERQSRPEGFDCQAIGASKGGPLRKRGGAVA